MADINVSTTPGTGTQGSTQDPQSAGSSAGSGTTTSSIQPGAVGNLDSTVGGVPLATTQLSTIAIPKASTSVAKPAAQAQPKNPLAIAGAALLIIVAVVLLVSILLPAKNTTE